MLAPRETLETTQIVVIHPMFDEPELKLSGEGLGRMKVSRSVKFSLILLRTYLVVMGVMLAYHTLDLAGMFHRR